MADPLAEALDALEHVQSDPRRTRDVALRLLDGGADGEPQVVALWALGRAQHELDDVSAAARTLGEAADAAAALGLREREAQIRMSRSVCLLADGDTPGALRELDQAEPALEGNDKARVVMQRGLVLYHLGRLAEALRDFDLALPATQRSDDRLAEARLLANRGVVRVFLGDLDGGEADQRRVQELAEQLGQHLLAAGALHNLGFLNGRRGDIPSALQWLERAEQAYRALGAPGRLTSVLDADVCDVLLAAGLTVEARAAAQRAVDAMATAGNMVNLAEARLLLARACLAQGDQASARDEADEAARAFRASDRATWAAFADYMAIQAGVAATQEHSAPPEDLFDRTLAIGAVLEEQGWRTEALHARTFAARAALAVDHTADARRALGDAAEARHRGSADLRARAWHATALLRLAEGDRVGARRAVSSGLRVVDEHRATLGASELRAHASAQGVDLARLGLFLALTDHRPTDVLAWADRWRSLALEAPPVRPPDDTTLARDLAELRRVNAEIRDTTLAGGDVTALEREVGQLEAGIRRHHRLARGAGGPRREQLDVAALRGRLAGRALTVSPSARLWASPRPSPTNGGVALVAGPDLPGAADEVEQLATIYPSATTLAATAAATDAVLAQWQAAAVVHLAAHGDFRADSPLFSSLRLADGPLTVYDIERAGAGPQTVVLSACDAARAGVQPGDELMGAGAALLSLGVRTVVAPLLPVSDRATTPMMVDFHRQLSHGRRPAEALAAAGRAARERGGPADLAAACSFICLGADDGP